MNMNTETDASLKERVNDILDSLNALPEGDDIEVNRCDILFIVISIVSRVMSIVSTLLLAISYYNHNKIDHFTWTLCCFIIPMFVTMFLQLSIYCEDRKDGSIQKLKIFDIIWSVIIFPILFRYWKTLVYTIKCKRAEMQNNRVEQKRWFGRLVNEDSDVALVRIFECFLEAAPQKILQISIILSGEESITKLQLLSLCSSIFSMAWCIASYHRYIRLSQLDKINISWIGSIIQSSWHLTITVSRILSIAIVASLFPVWTLLSFSIHAIVMGLWVFIFDRSPFCSNTFIHSLLFSLILGFVFIFNYILPKSRQTRYRYAIFYTLCFIENIICVAIYVSYSSEEDKQEDYFLILCILSIVPFIVGVFFMILYYLWFHPNLVSRRIYDREMHTISSTVDPTAVAQTA